MDQTIAAPAYVLTDISVQAPDAIQETDIVISGGKIADIGDDLRARYPAAEKVSAKGTIAFPGLMNAHTHSGENFRRGIASSASYDAWIGEVWGKIEQLSDQEAGVAVMLGAVEMLKRGVTSVLDHFRQIPMQRSAALAAAKAYETIGLDAVLALMVRDDRGATIEPQIDLCAGLIETNADTGVRFALGPSAPIRCTDRLLLEAGRLSEQFSVPLHMHLDETSGQRQQAVERYGKSAVSHLNDLGLLSPRLSLAHAVWIDDDDIGLLAESGAVVVHNPASNMRLGSGRAPISQMHKAGVRVALGSDGAASNDSQDILEAAKLALLLARFDVSENTGRWLHAADVFEMATDGGRAAFQREPCRIGIGMPADLIAVELNSPPMMPLWDPIAQLILGGPAIKVRHTFVAGNWIVRDGAVSTLDEQDLFAEARAISKSRLGVA
jgi:5-methylthioadenosine/S-adenosylhomocysteine deaminase